MPATKKNPKPAKKKIPKKMGRPRKEIDWDKAINLAKLQCTEEEIASVFDVSISTLLEASKRENSCTFKEFLQRYKNIGRTSLRRAQMNSAIKKGNPALLIFLGKQYLEQSDKQQIDLPVPTKILRADGSEHAILGAKKAGETDDDKDRLTGDIEE